MELRPSWSHSLWSQRNVSPCWTYVFAVNWKASELEWSKWSWALLALHTEGTWVLLITAILKTNYCRGLTLFWLNTAWKTEQKPLINQFSQKLDLRSSSSEVQNCRFGIDQEKTSMYDWKWSIDIIYNELQKNLYKFYPRIIFCSRWETNYIMWMLFSE